jgi:5-(carboxyamino)imidazole ribonucleotide synthase
MYNVLGPNEFQGSYALTGLTTLLSIPGVKLHLYGKMITKPRRKLGHITAVANSLIQSMRRAELANRSLKIIQAN